MHPFVFEIARLRVTFGAGRRARVPGEVEWLGAKRALIICDPSHARTAREIAAQLGDRCVGVYDQVKPHVPVDVANAGTAHAREHGVDCMVSIGGGSAIGLAKAVALETGIPIIAVPTTYAGSEMTPIWGLTADNVKRTGKDPRVQPRAVIYDAELVTTLPPHIAGPSGMNAMAHLVEGLYAENANPIMSSLAQEGVRALAQALPKVVRNPQDLEAQSEAQYGACLAGILLGSVGMALHHKLCHTLGGTFNTPHAETHSIILPYVTAFNIDAAPDARRRLEAALGTKEVAKALRELSLAVGTPPSLAALGLTEADLDHAADVATRTPYYNPREVTREAIRRLLGDAHQGVMPSP